MTKSFSTVLILSGISLSLQTYFCVFFWVYCHTKEGLSTSSACGRIWPGCPWKACVGCLSACHLCKTLTVQTPTPVHPVEVAHWSDADDVISVLLFPGVTADRSDGAVPTKSSSKDKLPPPLPAQRAVCAPPSTPSTFYFISLWLWPSLFSV